MGDLVARSRAEEGVCDFGRGERPTIQISWGDVSTAYHSTGIPDIEVHFEAVPAIRRAAQTPALVRSLLGLGFVQGFLKAAVNRMPEGPDEASRRAVSAVLVGEARDAQGRTVRTRLRTPEAYTLTALTALDAARRVAAGEVEPGFQTPSRALGSDYILSFEGVTREDLNS